MGRPRRCQRGGRRNVPSSALRLRVLGLCCGCCDGSPASAPRGDCHQLLEAEGLTPEGFVEQCAWEAMAPPRFCVHAAAVMFGLATEDPEGCAGCREACALGLMISSTHSVAGDTAHCSALLAPFILAKVQLRHVTGKTTLNHTDLRDAMDVRRLECAAVRRQELSRLSLPAAERPQRRLGGAPPRIGLLLAVNHEMLPTYQPFINLWRCYALRHGFRFILETDDLAARDYGRPWNWLRWLAAEKHLPFHDYLLVVDPDQIVVPECWNLSIASVVDVASSPDVVMRDVAPPQTLNNGVVFLRNSRRGRFFLRLLLRKSAWSGTIQHDQGAFDETVLEMLGLEAVSEAPGGKLDEDWPSALRVDRTHEGYDSHCLPFLFPSIERGVMVANYAMCWWSHAERLAGKAGQRRSQVIQFVDPRSVDINQVVGYRGMDVPALLYHFAGRTKDWNEILGRFGVPRRQTADCAKVFAHADGVAQQSTCVPGNRGVEDMFSYCEPPLAVC